MTEIVSDGSEIGIDPCSCPHPADENVTDARTVVAAAQVHCLRGI
jgi:hypothetical protein